MQLCTKRKKTTFDLMEEKSILKILQVSHRWNKIGRHFKTVKEERCGPHKKRTR